MKIVLVASNSSYTHTNPAVRILACCLCSRHEVKIIETTINDRGGVTALIRKLEAEKADLYAFSVYIWNRAFQITAAKMIKRLYPACKTLLGGPEISFEKENFFSENPEIDYILKGEGESVINEVADGIYPSHTIVDGGIYEDFCKSDEPYFENRYSQDTEVTTDRRLVYYESSRGCPYSCSYCLSSVKRKGEKVRFKDAGKVVREVKGLMSCNIRVIKFVDRTFNADIERAKFLFSEFIKLSKKKTHDGKYDGTMCHFEICASLIDEETVNILSAAPEGLFRFEIGIQTTNPKVLSEIGRRDDTEKLLEIVKKLRERTKVHIHLDLICGLPYDTYSAVRESFNRIYGLCDCLQMGMLKLLHGTKMREKSKEYGMISLDVPPYTVLETSSISFREMQKLSDISDLSERLSGSSSGFCESIKFLVSHSTSPFDFYEKVSGYLCSDDAYSGKRLYSSLFGFGKEVLSLSESDLFLLCEHLRYDFLISNQGRVPDEISREYTDHEKALLEAQKKIFIHSLTPDAPEFFIPALEAHIFGTDCENIFFIDRKNAKTEKLRLVTSE